MNEWRFEKLFVKIIKHMEKHGETKLSEIICFYPNFYRIRFEKIIPKGVKLNEE